jgi:methionyl-tRNA formyltransferase
MRIVYCGSGEFGLPCLDAIAASCSHQIIHIFTQPAHPAGRGKKLRPTPVAAWGEFMQIPVTQCVDINDIGAIEQIRGLEPDLMVVIAFGQKLSQMLIAIPAKGAINVHASLLPKYRGAAPINWAIIEGETETGVSMITLAETMDAGLILAQGSTAIGQLETASELHDRLAKLAAPILLETIDGIEAGNAQYRPQDPTLVSRAPKLKKADAFLDWNESAQNICNKIRGFWAWPEAQSYYVSKKSGKCERVIFALCRAVEKIDTNAAPGTFDENLHIVCADGAIEILKIKPAGSSLMDFKSFVNGRSCRPGDYFMPIEHAQEKFKV